MQSLNDLKRERPYALSYKITKAPLTFKSK